MFIDGITVDVPDGGDRAAGEGCKAALSAFDYLIRLAPAEVELAA